MRLPARPMIALALALGSSLSLAATSALERLEYPSVGRLSIAGAGARSKVSFEGTWTGAAGPMFNPAQLGATLRVAGAAGEGDTGVIELPAKGWKALKKGQGFHYANKRGTVGGIRSVVVKIRNEGGSLALKGGGPKWRLRFHTKPAAVRVSLGIGTARWCAGFEGLKTRAVGRLAGHSTTPPSSCPCDNTTGTWEAIQKGVIARYGCLDATCHGASPGSGGLDLRPEVAHENLVDVTSQGAPDLKRVAPGNRNGSFLYAKLAKATLGGAEYANVYGQPMPQGLTPLSAQELEAVRLWIQAGAPKTGVVDGTDRLLGTCLPPADPLKIRPAPAPDPSEGFQIHAPPWSIAPRDAATGLNGEAEVCYATYFDVSDRIPAEDAVPCPDFWGGGSATCFQFDGSELTQDPNSHHSIIHLYRGSYDVANPPNTLYTCDGGGTPGVPCDPNGPACPGRRATCRLDPGFGQFQCFGKDGASDGRNCNPTVRGVAAPDGADCGEGSWCRTPTSGALACIGWGPNDFVASVTGSGSSSAPTIGGSQQPYSKNKFAEGVYGVLPAKGVVIWNSHAFNVAQEPTTNEQYLNFFFGDPAKRQWVARGIFDASDIFVQNVPPYEQREYCKTFTLPQGARLTGLSSHNHKRGILWRTWQPPNTPCNPGEPACVPDSRTPTVTSTYYNDPVQYTYPTPLALDGADPASRSIKFCALYDNGFNDPTTVKRYSRSPNVIIGGKLACGPGVIECLADGQSDPRKGRRCGTGGQADDRVCDSSAGANDGICDACPLTGGVSTEDEMFILLGDWYLPTP